MTGRHTANADSPRSDSARFLDPFARLLGQPLFWLPWALLLHAHKLQKNYRDSITWDTEHFYFPMAKKLLSEGWMFLAKEESAYYPLLTYAYPALFGSDALAVKTANGILSLAVLLLLYRCGSLLHSRWAGLAAAILYAISPSLLPLMPTALTEPPYIFFSVFWFWTLCELHRCGASTPSWRTLALVGSGGLALGFAANMRANWLYALYASVAILPLLIWRFRQFETGTFLKRIWCVQFTALAICALVIAKNAVLIGFPALTSGAGNALYYGMHPVNQGMEPNYLGLQFDDKAATGGLLNLSPQGDRTLKGIAMAMAKDRSLSEHIEYFGQKLGRWLFLPNNLLPRSWNNPRSQRILLILLAGCGLIALWRRGGGKERILTVVLATILAYQTALHLPVLYSDRYSIGSLDVWLILLAGTGLASLAGWIRAPNAPPRKRSGQRLARVASVLGAAWALLYLGVWHRHHYGPGQTLQLSPQHYTVEWKHGFLDGDSRRDALPSLRGGFVATGEHPAFSVPLPSPENAPGVHINSRQFQANLALQLELHLDKKTGQCTGGIVTYTIHNHGRELLGSLFPFRLNARQGFHSFGIGVSLPTPAWEVPLQHPGTLGLQLECTTGTHIADATFSVVNLRMADHYRKRWLAEQAVTPAQP